MKARHEIERTCKRDGTKWYVSLVAASEKMPNKLMMVGAGMQTAGSRMSMFGRTSASAQSLQLELKAERVRKNNSCPACGSQAFESKKVRIK